MPIINRIAEFHDEMTAWRHKIHAHPETAFEEVTTGDFVAAKLAEFGIEVHRGLAGTGVVGTLKGNGDGPGLGLRADMDALHIHEKNETGHRSQIDGKMHACGHDGHTTMLLGAARYLSETRNFNGTVQFIFQPAEEHEGGGRVMVEDGLFDKFPMETVFGMHNLPGLDAGRFAVRSGAAMAAADSFDHPIHPERPQQVRHDRGGLGHLQPKLRAAVEFSAPVDEAVDLFGYLWQDVHAGAPPIASSSAAIPRRTSSGSGALV